MDVTHQSGPSATHPQSWKVGKRHTLIVSPVFDTYWRFAAERQALFMRRLHGRPCPWTTDEILGTYRFTNVYRAADRVSQYLIKNVIYSGDQTSEEVFFRTLLFKLFNRIETWELLQYELGQITCATFQVERYSKILDLAMSNKATIYSPAYIIPPPQFGAARKHRNHLLLLEHILRNQTLARIEAARSLEEVFQIFASQPSFGPFLAFQFAIDLNYSEVLNFSEMDFVVAGPGAQSGIRKCILDSAGLDESSVIRAFAEAADSEFERRGLEFQSLWGRPLQLIDCQNLFCEVDKYSRVRHPDVSTNSGRTRIKQRFRASAAPLPQWYPPKWGLRPTAIDKELADPRTATNAQLGLDLSNYRH